MDPNLAGMFYDIDAAILSALRVDDSDVSITCEESGEIVAAVRVPYRLRSLQHLTQAFYRFWGRVSLERSEVVRRLTDQEIVYTFSTGNDDRLTYRGTITFWGESVRRLLARVQGHQTNE
ncbi:MAG: hypothetical protein ACRDJN_28770 [Chloroflexota bacterium]